MLVHYIQLAEKYALGVTNLAIPVLIDNFRYTKFSMIASPRGHWNKENEQPIHVYPFCLCPLRTRYRAEF